MVLSMLKIMLIVLSTCKFETDQCQAETLQAFFPMCRCMPVRS